MARSAAFARQGRRHPGLRGPAGDRPRLRAAAARPDRAGLPHPPHRESDRRGSRRACACAIEGVVLRLGEGGQLEFELKNVRVADAERRDAGAGPVGDHLAQPQGTAARAHRPRKRRSRSRRACSLFYGEDGTLSLKFSTPGRGAGERACASRRRCAAPTAIRAAAAGADDDGALARIDLVKVLSEVVGARAPRASRPAPICARSGSGPPPSSSTTAAARASGACRSWTSISTTAAAAARLPAAPRSTR